MDVDTESQDADTDARNAHVMIVYEDEKGKDWRFKRK